MPFTTEDFLEALNLPEDHPYLVDGVLEPKEVTPWSLSNYFASVSAKKSLSNRVYAGYDECSTVSSSSPWENVQSFECNIAVYDTDSCSKRGLSADKVSFFQEIKPCLISTCRMAVLLWAPVILFLCIKRLTTPHRHAEPRKLVYTAEHSDKNTSSCLAGASVIKRCTMSKGRQSSGVNQTSLNDNKAVACFTSILSSSTPMFTIEERVNEHHSIPYKQQKSISVGEFCTQCTGTGDPLSYIIAVVVSAIIMMDAMYILEFSQAILISLHLFIISIGIKRVGLKFALLIAFPITSLSFFKVFNQDLDLPTVKPGLYHSETNPIVSKAVTDYWPIESRTYEGGTPWILTGDTRTGLPFLMYSPRKVQYTRRYVFNQ